MNTSPTRTHGTAVSHGETKISPVCETLHSQLLALEVLQIPPLVSKYTTGSITYTRSFARCKERNAVREIVVSGWKILTPPPENVLDRLREEPQTGNIHGQLV
ncbi:hypothetical protein J6590_052418 [Homalodisca vitripennis]|nr:hypothetical protein J6590_052418 [Homalodisca vitripennis]